MGTKSATSPVLQAIILADEVYIDRETGKKVICGTFNKLWSPKFPAERGRSTKAFICLTNCHTQPTVKLRYVDLNDDNVLMETPDIRLRGEVGQPLKSHELIVEVPGFPMPHPGFYAFEVYCNSQLLGSIRIEVAKQKTD